MGVYNEYEDHQIKVGDLRLYDFKINDKAEIPDGIYISQSGYIVIKDGIFIAEFSGFDWFFDKWGGQINLEELLDERSPMTIALARVMERQKKEDLKLKNKKS